MLVALSMPALADETCNFYAARDYPTIKLIEDAKTVTVKWDRYSERYDKVVTKRMGVLVEGAYDPADKSQSTHVFTRTPVGGVDAIIFDSLIFYPACEIPD